MSASTDSRWPSGRGIAAWLLLAVIGFVLVGAAGLAPAYFVAVVVFARLDRRVLGFVGVSFVGLAGLHVLVSSPGGEQEVHLDFVVRSFVPHHLTFIGLTLVFVQIVLETRSAPDVHEIHHGGESHPSDERGTEPLGAASPLVRIAAVGAIGLVSLLMILGAG